MSKKPPLTPDAYRWYRREPSKALAGMRGLNPEQRGVYCTIIELVYEARGPLADDDVTLARECQCDIRKYRRIKAELVERVRIVVRDGLIFDERAVRELVAKQMLSETQSKRAKAPRPKRRTRNKVVNLVVHEGGAKKGTSATRYATATRHGTPEVPPASVDSKGEKPSQEKRLESISSGGAKTGQTEAPRRPAAKGGGASSKGASDKSGVRELRRVAQAAALAALQAKRK